MQKCNLWPEIFHFSHDPYYRPPRPRQAAKQPNATVKSKICPIHYFRCIYATIKKYVPNDLVKLTVTSVVFGFHIIAIVFVCWHRQFWHFHPIVTDQWNFNRCQNKNSACSLYWLDSPYSKESCIKWTSSSNCTISKLWFTATVNSFCMVAQTILTFSPCRHRAVKF